VGNSDEDDDDNFVEEEARAYGREIFGNVARPYLITYVYKGRFREPQYSICEGGDVFMDISSY